MRENVRAFLQIAAETFGLEGPVYEFGVSSTEAAADANWPHARPPETKYVGCRRRGESEDDPLEDPARLPFADRAAKTVICVDTLGYVLEPRRTVREMVRILAPGGILLIASSVDPRLPDHPDRYWRPTATAIQALLAGLEATLVGSQGGDRQPHTLFGIGQKSPLRGEFVTGAGRFLDLFQQRLDRAADPDTDQSGGSRKRRRWLGLWPPTRRARLAQRDYHQAQFVLHLPVDQSFKHDLLINSLPQQTPGTRIDQMG
jgi:SAM-dependent methyltransferase